MGKKLFLTMGFLAGVAWAQNPLVMDPKLLADERIWPLLVDEKVGFCVGDSIYREKLDKVAGDRVFFKAGAFAYMPRGSLPLSKVDSVLVWLPLHEGGVLFGSCRVRGKRDSELYPHINTPLGTHKSP